MMLGTEVNQNVRSRIQTLRFEEVAVGLTPVVSTQIYILELDGKPVGRINSVSLPTLGGSLDLQTVNGQIPKHIAQSKPDDFAFECETGMSRIFFDWIKDSFKSNYSRKNGAVVAVGHDQVEKYRMDFVNAMITAFALPKLDRSSKGPERLSVRISSEDAKISQPGTKTSAKLYLSGAALSPAGFKVSIDKLEKDCEAVVSIESISAGTKPVVDYYGRSRIPTISPGSTRLSDIVMTVPQSKAIGFFDWFEKTAVGGKTDSRNGTVEYSGPDSKTTYYTLNLSGMGLTEAATTDEFVGKERLAKVKLYCESMDFSAGSAAVL
jgi:hypothetical protein